MTIWEQIFLGLTILGVIVTLQTSREAYLDLKVAPENLKESAKNFFRHEFFRLIKQILLVIAIGAMYFRDSVELETIILIRNGVLVIISLFILLNSLLDLSYRKMRRKQAWQNEIEEIRKEARQRLNDLTNK